MVLFSAVVDQEEAKAAGTVTFHWEACGHLTSSGTQSAGQTNINALAGAVLSQKQAAAEICLSVGAQPGLSQQAQKESGQGQEALRLQAEEYGQAQALAGADCTGAPHQQPAQSPMARPWVHSEHASSAGTPPSTARSHQALTH